jgi:hypothetical protein
MLMPFLSIPMFVCFPLKELKTDLFIAIVEAYGGSFTLMIIAAEHSYGKLFE